MIALLPLDMLFLQYKQLLDDEEREATQYTLETMWNFFYFTAFFLCWIIYPFLCEFVSTGDFTFMGRLKTGFKNFLFYYSIAIVFFIIFLIYLWTQHAFNSSSFLGFIIALSNAWGLFQIIIFLGYGIVSVPEQCFKHANIEKLYKYQMFKISHYERNYERAIVNMDELARDALTLKFYTTRAEIQHYLQIVIDNCPLETLSYVEARDNIDLVKLDYAKGDIDSLTYLNRDCKWANLELIRREVSYEQELEYAFYIEDLYKNQSSHDYLIHSRLFRLRDQNKCMGRCRDKTYFFLHIKLIPKIFYILALIALAFSIQILVGEMIILLDIKYTVITSIIPDSIVTQILTNIYTVILLFYLSFCIYYGCFNVKFSSVYELHPKKQTDSFSLLYSANILTRLATPLCINFLKIIHFEGTIFSNLIGAMDPIPIIGKEFQNFFPVTLLIVIIFNYFNVWSKLMYNIGFDEYTFSEVYNEELVPDGEQLSKIERTQREDEILKYHRDKEERGHRVKYGYLYTSKFFIDNPQKKPKSGMVRIRYEDMDKYSPND
eukprot:403366212